MTNPPVGPTSEGPADSPEPPGQLPDNDVQLTSRQRRRAARDERRQAKDAAYELRQQRKRDKDGTSWRGHHIVDTRGLSEAFPEPETPEFSPVTVRRRILHGIILVLLLALVVAGVVLAGMIQRGELELKTVFAKPTPTQVSCPAEILDYAANKTVTVNVYNGGSIEGQAGKVAAELKKRGFVVKEVANKPAEISAPAIVVSGPSGHAAALSLQRNFPGSDYVEDDRVDGSVDVVLTSDFTVLTAVPNVSQEAGVLSCPRLNPPPNDPTTAPSPDTPVVPPVKP